MLVEQDVSSSRIAAAEASVIVAARMFASPATVAARAVVTIPLPARTDARVLIPSVISLGDTGRVAQHQAGRTGALPVPGQRMDLDPGVQGGDGDIDVGDRVADRGR